MGICLRTWLHEFRFMLGKMIIREVSRGYGLPDVVVSRKYYRRTTTAVVLPQYNMEYHDEPLTPMKLRERAGLTQKQVADALGKTVGTVSNWERLVKEPRLKFSEVQRLISLYGCTLDELIQAFESDQAAD